MLNLFKKEISFGSKIKTYSNKASTHSNMAVFMFLSYYIPYMQQSSIGLISVF